MVFKEFCGFERFTVDLVESGYPVIPFEKSGRVTAELDGMAVHLPDRVKYRMVVRIENVFLELGVARNVDLPDAMVRGRCSNSRRD